MDYLAARQAASERLTFRCQKMLLGLLKADRDAREEAGMVPRGKKAKIASIPILPVQSRSDCAEGAEGLMLTLLTVPKSWRDEEAELVVFWSATKWLPGDASELSGTSWVEIYALYRS